MADVSALRTAHTQLPRYHVFCCLPAPRARALHHRFHAAAPAFTLRILLPAHARVRRARLCFALRSRTHACGALARYHHPTTLCHTAPPPLRRTSLPTVPPRIAATFKLSRRARAPLSRTSACRAHTHLSLSPPRRHLFALALGGMAAWHGSGLDMARALPRAFHWMLPRAHATVARRHLAPAHHTRVRRCAPRCLPPVLPAAARAPHLKAGLALTRNYRTCYRLPPSRTRTTACASFRATSSAAARIASRTNFSLRARARFCFRLVFFCSDAAACIHARARTCARWVCILCV